MPNYGLVINSKFTPFSYQELLAPVMAATQAQQQVEEAYANMEMQAALAGSKVNEQTDPVAYNQYKAYEKELRGLADRLAKEGLSPSDRRTMYGMRARYAKDIVPIETAYATRKAQADQQQAAKLQNPTLLLDRDASTTSLDEYIKNPNLSYNSYSGALLTQQVSTAVANMAKTDAGRTQLKQLLPYQYETIRQRGFRPQEVMEAIMNSPNANKILTGVVENVMDASGIKSWANERTLADAYNYARMGLYNGIGETVYGSVTDSAGMARLQSDLAEQRAVNAFNRQVAYAQQAQAAAQAGNFTPNFERRNVATQEEIAKNNSDWDKYKKYFVKTSNGNWALTKEGRNQDIYTTKVGKDGKPEKFERGRLVPTEAKLTPFGKFLQENGLMEIYNGRTGPYQSAKVEKFMGASGKSFDATLATEYTKGIDTSQYDNVIAALNRVSTDGQIRTVSRKKQNGKYVLTSSGKKLEVSELKPENIKSATNVFGEHGDYLELKLANGETHLVPFSTISSNYSDIITGNKGTIQGYRKMLQEGKTHVQSPVDGQIYSIEDMINAELNSIGNNMMSGYGLTQVEPDKVARGLYTTQ